MKRLEIYFFYQQLHKIKAAPKKSNCGFFLEFELKPTGKDSAEPTQHEFQHHIV